ncbi:hypothetical protein KZ829_18745 [Actinoplanes hulinensis]|uniref:DUF4350 domain-containing protein n=1 Tax=Actinoplanes hulinensis TaxID=1144547 RepID=A0ABS7B4R8_9ACTN|nr:DUF4350 domain-containing protein [Actinoplanes hulinensis]MBW6435784.1 hypothetical protein [Actinoplanes hulinensis]
MKRWMRVAIPFGLLTAAVTGTLIVHAVEQPDPDDPEYLTPVHVQEISGGTLAERLVAEGVTVERATTTEDAVTAVTRAGRATLFLSTPDLADLPQLRKLPRGTNIVAVAPSELTLRRIDWPVSVEGSHWTSTVTDPGCADPVATAAGPAAVRRTEYQADVGTTCYAGGLVSFSHNGLFVTVAGSPDPFRDDRIAEHGNAPLAVGLLSRDTRMVWLDVHEPDVTPTTPPPTPEYTPSPTPIGDHYDEDGEYEYYDDEDGGYGEPGEADGQGEAEEGDGEGEDESNAGGGSPLRDDPFLNSLPSTFWATLLLLVLILIALAVAAARRLGAPVTEPLPSQVPANETMLGHARLYAVARARDESMLVLRDAARRRLITHLNLPPDADTEQIAHAAGLPVRYVRDILDRDPPESNSDLVEAATLLQGLVRDVTGTHTEEGDPS